MRTGTFLAGTGSLPVALTAQNWLRVTLEIGLGDGVRTARMDLLLPHAAAGRDDADRAEEIALPDPDWTEAMDRVARTAPVRLDAVLPPLRLTLADLVALKPGDEIPLDGAPLEELRLLSGMSGRGRPGRARMPYGLTLSARLGRVGTARAVRLSADPGRAAKPGSGKAAAGDTLAAPAAALALAAADGPDDLAALPDLPGGVPGDAADGLAADGFGLGGEGDPLDLEDLLDLPALPDLPDLD